MTAYRFTDNQKADPIIKCYQEKLNTILRKYHCNWEYLYPNGLYDISTAYCVKAFQIYRNITPASGELNIITMNCIDELCEQSTILRTGLIDWSPCSEKPSLLDSMLNPSKNQLDEWEKMKEIKLSEHFTIAELCVTNKSIPNIPNNNVIFNLYKLCNQVLEPIRKHWGAAITVTSGYRCEAINNSVNGSKTSQHLKGEAADLIPSRKGRASSKYIKAVFFETILEMINKKEIQVGQLIWEYGTVYEPAWVHVSLPYTKINDVISIPKGRKKIHKNTQTGIIEIE